MSLSFGSEVLWFVMLIPKGPVGIGFVTVCSAALLQLLYLPLTQSPCHTLFTVISLTSCSWLNLIINPVYKQLHSSQSLLVCCTGAACNSLRKASLVWSPGFDYACLWPRLCPGKLPSAFDYEFNLCVFPGLHWLWLFSFITSAFHCSHSALLDGGIIIACQVKDTGSNHGSGKEFHIVWI